MKDDIKDARCYGVLSADWLTGNCNLKFVMLHVSTVFNMFMLALVCMTCYADIVCVYNNPKQAELHCHCSLSMVILNLH